MAVKIRLQRHGRKKAPYYHIVIADARSPRDGKFIENIGMYNPIAKPANIDINRDRALHWVMQGAEPTDTVKAILRYKGVMFRKHLQLGVNKGAITQETADQRYNEWITKKEGQINEAVQKNKASIDAYHSQLIAVNKVKKPKVAEPEAVAEPEVAATEVAATEVAAAEPEAEKTNETTE
ncbi:MAG: 30S ribosomal protein S16 [Saprospiraceae bacterium]|nr:30S ribosomal protein S16 [Saprospiraceae bacterium]